MGAKRGLDNLILFRNSQNEPARGSLLKLSRTTLIMEVYNPYSIVQLSEVLHELEIRSGDRAVYRGRAVVTNLVNTGLMLIVSARLVDNWSELAGVLGDRERVREEVEAFVGEWRETHRIQPGYQLAVTQIRSFLTELNRWLEHLDLPGENAERPGGQDADAELLNELCEPVLPELNGMFQQFEAAAAEVGEEERTAHIRYAQRDLHPLLLSSPFVHRAYSKPLGYAGDYEMVNMMLRPPYEGPTVYARMVNALYLQAGPPAAHRNRIEILEGWLAEAAERAERPLRALNVGCGPAVELQRLVQDCPSSERYRLRLMDFNQTTLDYCRDRLSAACAAAGRRPEVEFVHESVHNLLKSASRPRAEEPEPSYDIVYCAGLFDYLSDKVCSRLLRLFHRWLAPGGRILVTNVHSNNANVHAMEHLMEWYLIHRDEAGMERLVPREWIRRLFVDDTGMNIFMELAEPADA